MKAAIDAGLGYTKAKGQGEAGGDKTAAAKPAEKKPAAAGGDGKETETHHANGKPKKNEKGESLDVEGKVVPKQAPKVKTAAELDLKPEQKKLLAADTRIRFGELINTLKTHEVSIAKQTETIKGLTEARDALLGVMQETNTTQDELAGYLEFNALLKSKNPKDLETALSFIETQRATLYKALGREPKGGDIDLLAEFPDLKKQVDEEEITRAAALEIAAGPARQGCARGGGAAHPADRRREAAAGRSVQGRIRESAQGNRGVDGRARQGRH
jgi:hypothetical protein